ncbi:beta-ribofuranosylaminobenzene 5'-phosphate synthase family protein [Aquamicrobium sp. LC103]|uniref:beta-ribofuranosylaminobenzene 5'-phosphate synthase family protein n=1 Tax=Aquamicrobium sp. LC103 TaxID=1120658 RepID=UPI00063EAE04|nr:beta-ribofuranosylaminobenzene 5'-phosphate synthase family protein [Aquamicrobium sp. LC103]TKT69351.1 GHMP kinase [Aquamicrobium sp. LC103]
MSNSITVKVPARLHLGFLDIEDEGGRRFGSIGLPLTSPETVLTLSRAAVTSVEGPDADRAAGHLRGLCRHLGIRSEHRLIIEDAIPNHAGLGSGTQIALAVSAALRGLHGLPPDITGDALLLGRGARSGVGIASFEAGGLIVDAGRRHAGSLPTVVARVPFPEEWRILLVLDGASSGLHGAQELEAFRSLPPLPREVAGENCRHALMGALPALAERDIAAFGFAISAIQRNIGTHFAPAQGGLFTSPRVKKMIEALARAGAVGIGQSSWGPTGFAFAPSETSASEMVRVTEKDHADGLEIRIVGGRNSGAEIIARQFNLVGS